MSSTNKTLLRQIHPNFIQQHNDEQIISSQAFSVKEEITPVAFRPNSGDKGRMSVYDNSIWDYQKSYEHYTKDLEKKSAGVLGITQEECENNKLTVDYDNDPFLGHTSVVFQDNKNFISTVSKILTNQAVQRGWLYKPDDFSENTNLK